MNKKHALLLLPLILLPSCGEEAPTYSSSPLPPEESSFESSIEASSSEITSSSEEGFDYRLRTPNSLLADPKFQNGFRVNSKEIETAHTEGVLDYLGERETEFYAEGNATNTYWTLSQWGAAHSIYGDATVTKEGDAYRYDALDRVFAVNPKEGSFTMEVDTFEEYNTLYGGTKPNSAFWSHFLIETNFPGAMQRRLADLDSLYVQMDVTLDEITCKGEEPAQLLFYFCFADAETGRNLMWFGLPLLDTRHDSVPVYHAYDNLTSNNTNLPIYSIESKLYMGKEKPKPGNTYHINFECIDYVKEAFVYWYTNGAIPSDIKYKNLLLRYFNFGWEIPGQYKVKSTCSNFDIYSLPEE